MDINMLHRAVLELRRQGFTSVKTGDMQAHFTAARKGFEAILADPIVRELFTINEKDYQCDELGEPYEIGLLSRKHGGAKSPGTAGFFDIAAGRFSDDANKERFHYSPKLLHRISGNDRAKHMPFLVAVDQINKHATEMVRTIAREFDRVKYTSTPRYPCYLDDRIAESVAITRLIRYGKVDGSQPDAQVHRDRDCFTVHHYSSHPGLRLFDKEKVPHTTSETDPAVASIFTGEKFWAATRGVFGTGVPHGVFDDRRASVVDQSEPRFVVVTFVHMNLDFKDVTWINANLAKIKLDPAEYRY